MSSKSFTFNYLEHICELEKCCATCTCIQNALADLFTQYGSYNGLAAYRLTEQCTVGQVYNALWELD